MPGPGSNASCVVQQGISCREHCSTAMRRSLVAVIVVPLLIYVAWWLQRRPSPALPPPGELHAVAPPASEWPATATRRAMPPPAIALERPVVLRPARTAGPGALEGTVVD